MHFPPLPAPVPGSVYLRPDNNRSASNAGYDREILFSLSVSNLLELENETPANRDGIEYLTGWYESFKRASDFISYWMKHVSVLLCARFSHLRMRLTRASPTRMRLTRVSLTAHASDARASNAHEPAAEIRIPIRFNN